MATLGDTSAINPWRRRDELEASAQAALNVLRERGEAEISLQKTKHEDELLGHLTTQLQSGKSLYAPELSPIVAAVAGTRHAPVLNYLSEAQKARESTFFPARQGEQVEEIYADPVTGERKVRPTGISVPPRPIQERGATVNDMYISMSKLDKEYWKGKEPSEDEVLAHAGELMQQNKEELKLFNSQGKLIGSEGEYKFNPVTNEQGIVTDYQPTEYIGNKSAEELRKIDDSRAKIMSDLNRQISIYAQNSMFADPATKKDWEEVINTIRSAAMARIKRLDSYEKAVKQSNVGEKSSSDKARQTQRSTTGATIKGSGKVAQDNQTRKDYTKMSEDDLYDAADRGDEEAYKEAKRRGLVK